MACFSKLLKATVLPQSSMSPPLSAKRNSPWPFVRNLRLRPKACARYLRLSLLAGAHMLRAIEEEHFDQLPGGVFNKGFIRAYAKHLGLNDEEAVSDYLACLRQAQIDAHEVWEPEASAHPSSAQRLASERRRSTDLNQATAKTQSPVQVEELPDLQLPRAEHVRPSREKFARRSDREIPWRILAVAVIVAVLATILWIRHSHSTHTAATNSSAATQPATTAAPG